MSIRVALLVDSPSKRAHGNAASRLALGLVESTRADVELVCYSDDPAPSWLPASVGVHRLGADRISRSLPALVRYLGERRPDVLITRQVHANFVGLAAATLARRRHHWQGKLVLVQDHLVQLAHASNARDNKWVAKVGYRFADGIIGPSPTVVQNVVDWCRVDPSCVALVPNPIPVYAGGPTDAPHPWLEEGEPPVFLHVSNLLPFKRVDLVIDALAEVRRHHDARLLVLGEGPDRGPADARIRALGLQDSARTVGWVDDPLPFAARARALVHPSDEDGFAQVLTEAMSVGCPVVTADAQGGGPRFVTDEGQYGILIPRGDCTQLAAAMSRMLEDDVRAHYARLGLRRVESMSPLASATALLGFLDTLGAVRV